VTPPISAGCLPGILRQKLIKSGEVTVKTVTLGDLMAARSVVVGNSLRGKIRADLNRT
jgi:branched-subunit amino acid aminotransferase/4-amino-4-deoxychorismate lyase